MKPIYVVSYDGNLRPSRATREDIEFHVANPQLGERLVYVTIDGKGDIETTPLTADEIAALDAAFKAEQEQKLRALLDGALALSHLFDEVPSALWSSPICLWPADEPWSERVMREWASEHGLEVEDESPPRAGKNWIRTARASHKGRELARCQWPSVEVNTEAVISVEVAQVAAERAKSDAELGAIEVPF